MLLVATKSVASPGYGRGLLVGKVGLIDWSLNKNLPMSHDDIRDQILRIEANIEELTELVERCSKLILLSKITIAIGGIWLLAITLGAVWFDPTTLIGAIAVVIGGIVVFGSNTSTLKQATLDIKADEALRAELIDRINLPVAGENSEVAALVSSRSDPRATPH